MLGPPIKPSTLRLFPMGPSSCYDSYMYVISIKIGHPCTTTRRHSPRPLMLRHRHSSVYVCSPSLPSHDAPASSTCAPGKAAALTCLSTHLLLYTYCYSLRLVPYEVCLTPVLSIIGYNNNRWLLPSAKPGAPFGILLFCRPLRSPSQTHAPSHSPAHPFPRSRTTPTRAAHLKRDNHPVISPYCFLSSAAATRHTFKPHRAEHHLTLPLDPCRPLQNPPNNVPSSPPVPVALVPPVAGLPSLRSDYPAIVNLRA